MQLSVLDIEQTASAPPSPANGQQTYYVNTPSEGMYLASCRPHHNVAPLRGRGLKRRIRANAQRRNDVAPLRGRGLKRDNPYLTDAQLGRPPAGAWIETIVTRPPSPPVTSPPLRGRGLKRPSYFRELRQRRVAPLRGRGLKQEMGGEQPQEDEVAPLRGRGLKRLYRRRAHRSFQSPPCEGVD